MKLRQHLRDRNMSMHQQLSTSRLKVLAEQRQELIDALELQVRAHGLTTLAGSTNSSAKRVKLTLYSNTLCIELINGRVTLLKRMLLTNH
jgi:hypothetical protein